MYRHTLDTHDSRRAVLSPGGGAILAAVGVAVLVPLVATIVLSYPDFGVGILAGAVLTYAVRGARRIGVRLARYGALLRAARPAVNVTEPSNTGR